MYVNSQGRKIPLDDNMKLVAIKMEVGYIHPKATAVKVGSTCASFSKIIREL